MRTPLDASRSSTRRFEAYRLRNMPIVIALVASALLASFCRFRLPPTRPDAQWVG